MPRAHPVKECRHLQGEGGSKGDGGESIEINHLVERKRPRIAGGLVGSRYDLFLLVVESERSAVAENVGVSEGGKKGGGEEGGSGEGEEEEGG